jgi:hypothetical protein
MQLQNACDLSTVVAKPKEMFNGTLSITVIFAKGLTNKIPPEYVRVTLLMVRERENQQWLTSTLTLKA